MAIRFFILWEGFLFCLFLQPAYALTLHFQYTADDGTDQIAADDFYAIGLSQEGLSDSLDSSDLRKPPALPGPGTRIYTSADTTTLIGDYRFLNAAMPNRSWPIQTFIAAGNPSETVQHTLDLLDPEELGLLPEGAMLYLRRYDSYGTFIDYYDLTDSGNHTIQWQTEPLDDPDGQIDLVLISPCIAANLDGLGAVDLKDFAVVSDSWMQSGIYGIADIDGNDTADLSDVVILAQYWLSECLP